MNYEELIFNISSSSNETESKYHLLITGNGGLDKMEEM